MSKSKKEVADERTKERVHSLHQNQSEMEREAATSEAKKMNTILTPKPVCGG